VGIAQAVTETFIVDAYNLLFWCLEGENLEKERQQLIQEVNLHAKRRGLDVTLVFDATWTNDPLARGHYDALEIIFTAKGVTADDHIVDLVCQNPHVVVVTSDKALARHCRQEGAKTVSTPDFYHWLKRARMKGKSKEKVPKIDFPPPKVVLQEGSLFWYQRLFEARLEEQRNKNKKDD